MSTITFCRECNNMLYPKEDKQSKTLLFQCRNCGHKENASHPRISRNEILQSTDDQYTVIVHDLASDPTLPRTNARCQKCGFRQAVYFQSLSSKAKESMTLYFVCCAPNCGHRWKE
mmetsp:Transcript_8711/g.12025  ORF Transcript_8711/g.12025 Transcript_8711/m.12025 type:complete len:116 (-) Transcript_8711:190-537(-)